MQPTTLLRLAHLGMVLGLLLSLSAIYLAYGVPEALGLGIQVGAHMSLIPFATLMKFSYIARLVALKRLNRPVN